MPIAIIEALSIRRAVISTEVGGIGEWLRDGSNARLVSSEDPAALARAITDLTSNVETRRTLAITGRRTFERHFELEQFGQRFAAVLHSTTTTGGRSSAHEQGDYAKWIHEFDTLQDDQSIALRRSLRALPRHPLISVVLPVYDPEIEFLRKAIASVKAQVYESWELCIADDASTNFAIRELLEFEAQSDRRIHVAFREQNGHISACSNSALALAAGEWCALLDHDDELAPDALAFVAIEINRTPDVGLVYSDEDKIDAEGVRSNPFFKTDWNPQLFLGQNFINHLGVYRTDLLRAVGGFREGFEGSQDYDLALRCVEQLRPHQIRHIPRILYHWRMAAGSLAGVVDAKPYAREAARRALTEHVARIGAAATVEPCPENNESHRVRFEIVGEAPLVSVIILTRDRAALLEQCVTSLRDRTDYPKLEIVVVDNGSVEPGTDAYLRATESSGRLRVLRDDGAFNFSRLNNLAARDARGVILAFLNNDVEANEADWLREMVSHTLRPEVGAVGARLWYPDGTLQHGGVGGLARDRR